MIYNRKFLIKIMLFFTLVFIPSLSAQNEVDKILTLIENFYKKRENFKSDFFQKVLRRTPKKIFKRKGKVFFKKPHFMRWDYNKPEKIQYIYDGETLWIYQIEDAIVYKQNVKGSELYESLKFFTAEKEKIKEDFLVELRGKSKKGFIKLKLKPQEGKKSYNSLTLFIDEKTGEIKQTLLIDQLKNESYIIFKNISYEEYNKEIFKFSPPKGVRVQELSR